MAVSRARGVITQPGSTGSLAVTGLGFQPKLVLFFSSGQTASGDAVDHMLMQGAAVSSSMRMCCHVNGVDNSNNVGAGNWITRCIHLVTPGSTTVVFSADFTSMDSDGFTINVSTTDAGGRLVEWLALGGSDLANVAILQSNTPTSTGNQALTGAGFQPNFGLRFGGRGSTTTGSDVSSTALTLNPLRMAAVKSTTERWLSFQDCRSAGDNGVLCDNEIETIYNTGALVERADFVSWDADGVTINFDTASATSKFAFWVLMNLTCDIAVGTILQKTSTGTQAYTGPGTSPDVILLASNGLVASNTPAADAARAHRSVILSTSDYVSFGAHSDNSGATDPRARRRSATKAVELWRATATGGVITLDSAADVSSIDATGFTLDWTTADATARNIGYAVLGHPAGGSSIFVPLVGEGGLVGYPRGLAA